MTYINTTRKSRLTIAGVDVTSRMISWTASDESAFKNGIIKTNGVVVLGANNLSQFDYLKRRYKRGQEVILEIMNPDDSTYSRHPRGLLYVLGESFNPSTQEITIQTCCKLRLMELTENIDSLKDISPITLDPSRQDFSNIANAFSAASKYLYQNNQGLLISGSTFGSGTFGDVNSVETTWVSDSQTTALDVAPLVGAAPIPDKIKLSYSFSNSEPTDNPEERTEINTSTYGLKYPGVIFTRVGTGDIPTDTTGDGGGVQGSICGNSPQNPSGASPGSGNPGACSGIFRTIEEPTKKTATRTEVTTSVYGGPGKQISSVIKETTGPALELNPQYYADRYAYCRFNFATACNPNGNCETEGMESVLQLRSIETYRYSDDDGSLVERNLEEYRPTLAAAQPFDWRAGIIGAVPTDFTELSTASLFRAKITNQQYSVNADGANVEKTTISESSAVKSRAGINQTAQEVTTGGRLILGIPTSYPNLDGTLNGLAVDTVSGSGSGMTVRATFPDGSGEVLEAIISDYTYTNLVPNNDYFAGGSGQGFRGKVRRTESWNGGTLEQNPFKLEILDPGKGYSQGDLLTWTGVGQGGATNSFVIRLTKVRDNRPSLEIQSAGQGYKIGDSLQVSKATLQAAAGTFVSKGISFNIVGAPDTGVNGGKSIVSLSITSRPESFKRGHYTNVPTETVTGSGSGASINIESIETGVIERIRAYQTPRLDLSPSNPEFVQSVGEWEPEGGSGSGLKLELGVGEYQGTGNLVPSIIVIRGIVEQGSGYRRGDILTITWQDIEDNIEWNLLHELGGDGGLVAPYLPKDMKIVLDEVNRGDIYIFPSNPGANYQPGDQLKVTADVLVSIGAQEDGVGLDLLMTVRQVSTEVEVGSLRLDAAEGVQTVTINTSQTKSTLPESPDTVASPSLVTETVETTVQVRADQYLDSNELAGPLERKESIPVPLIGTKAEIEAAMNLYSESLKSFILGEVLGLTIGEALTDEILSGWKPMAGFRFTDALKNQTMAMRCDATTWSVNQNEAVCVMNGLWIGNEVVTTGGQQARILDQGNYTQQLDFHLNLGKSLSPASDRSGLITPIIQDKQCNLNYTKVIALEGTIVANGGTLTLGPDGHIPADLRGQILIDDVTIIDSDVFSDD